MAVPAIVDDITKVPEKDREHYVEKQDAAGKSQWILQGEGVKTVKDVETLQEALRKERGDHSKVKDELKRFANLGDPVEALAKLDRVTELEAIVNSKIDPTKLDELAEVRAKVKIAPLERELATTKQKLQESEGKLQNYETKDKTRQIHDAIRSVAAGSGILQTAIEDALAMGERVFQVTDHGEIITKENSGFAANVDAKVWLSEVQEKRPHWWPASNGGGARPANGGLTGSNPFTRENWNLTEQSKLVKENPTRAAQYASQAGTKIGGGMPPAKAK